ncbi:MULTISPECIES: IclR family transcriptional regulator [unclassified Streptomyces]|uniref:IclR family transcriptional regulator n=1 Tax=unclassified Streptomyces TaxID=2593676 RepID=UPI0020253B7A|nr:MULTISPECIES: IclR family transcriptional regulator [unclassified Streptomyces]WSV58141.1 IclR family transcriptional regulator [Streptomyces sp. NBC_01014]
MPALAATAERSPLSLLEKAARVLSTFAGPEPRLSLTEVVRRSGLPRSSTHRILDQLVQLRWLDRDGRDYRLGMGMLELGALASHHNRLRRAALPHLHALHETTGHVVHLAVLDAGEVVCLERIGGSDDAQLPPRVGARMPAYCTAAGKAMLAFGTQADVTGVLAGELPARTPRTVVRPAVLRSELAATRERGIAYDREESWRGVCCVAAPLRGAGRAVAAISVTRRSSHQGVEQHGPAVRACAGTIWRELYGPGRAVRERTRGVRDPDISEGAMSSMMGWLRFSEWM